MVSHKEVTWMICLGAGRHRQTSWEADSDWPWGLGLGTNCWVWKEVVSEFAWWLG